MATKTTFISGSFGVTVEASADTLKLPAVDSGRPNRLNLLLMDVSNSDIDLQFRRGAGTWRTIKNYTSLVPLQDFFDLSGPYELRLYNNASSGTIYYDLALQ